MMKTVNRVLLTAAAASMAVLPVAAQANTRAGDNGAIYSQSAPGIGRDAEGESIGNGGKILLALIAAGLVTFGIIKATDSKDDGQSPGT